MNFNNNQILHYWLTTLSFGAIVFLLCSYYYFFQGENLSLQFINKATAATAIILMGSSFILSGMGYFWDFLDTKIAYRKYLGLVGYIFILWHSLNSLYFYYFSSSGLDKFDVYNKWNIFGFEVSNIIPLVFGIVSLTIFSLMALISNNFATKKLGGILWRKLLRLGYIALLFGFFHFTIKNLAIWIEWGRGGLKSLPPMNIILAIFILFVIFLRLFLMLSLKNKKKVILQVEKSNPNINFKTAGKRVS